MVQRVEGKMGGSTGARDAASREAPPERPDTRPPGSLRLPPDAAHGVHPARAEPASPARPDDSGEPGSDDITPEEEAARAALEEQLATMQQQYQDLQQARADIETAEATLAEIEAVVAYRRARDAWAELAELAWGVYMEDVSYGPQEHLRGHWRDRLPAIDADVAAQIAESMPPDSPSTTLEKPFLLT